MPEQIKTKKKFISTPYNARETFGWLVRNAFGPSKRKPSKIQFAPHHFEANSIKKQFRIGFIGDIMDMRGNDLKIAPELSQYLLDCDYLVGNFEATLTDQPRHQFDQKQERKIIQSLKTLFPAEKTILSIANNHTGDFGLKICTESKEALEQEGFHTFGLKDNPRIEINPKLAFTTGTMWSNRNCDYVANLPTYEIKDPPSSACEILFPHWGYEMELYPRVNIIQFAKAYFQTYSCVVGHHSHVPQPITMVPGEINKFIAYSLGDFCTGLKLKNYSYGQLLKVDVGYTPSGKWAVGLLDWSFTRCTKIDRTAFQVNIVQNCPLHKGF